MATRFAFLPLLGLVLADRAEQARPGKSVLLLQRGAWSSVTLQDDSGPAHFANCSREPCLGLALPSQSGEGKRALLAVGHAANLSANSSQPLGEPLDAEELDDFDSEEDEKRWSRLLPLELHLGGVTIAGLLDKYSDDGPALMGSGEGRSSFRSVASLLIVFQKELAQACNLSKNYILMNALFGRFLHESSSAILKSTSSMYPMDSVQGRASLMSTVVPFNERLGEEVVVRFFVYPRSQGDDFASLVTTLQDALSNSSSSLMTGNLSEILQHASLTTGYQ
ncbi:unnamed protein product, partial [Effrenium voratum]